MSNYTFSKAYASKADDEDGQDEEKERLQSSCFPMLRLSSMKNHFGDVKRTIRKKRQLATLGSFSIGAVQTEFLVQKGLPSSDTDNVKNKDKNIHYAINHASSSTDAASAVQNTQPIHNGSLHSSPASQASRPSSVSSKGALLGPPQNFAEQLQHKLLHVQVIGASTLVQTGSYHYPYCKVTAGGEQYRTHPVPGSLNPIWNSAFAFRGKQVVEKRSFVAFEVWSNDDFHPDHFLGQAELDLKVLPTCEGPEDPLLCTLSLYVLIRAGKRERGDFGELKLHLWLTPDSGDKGAVLAPGAAAAGKQPAGISGKKILPYVLQTEKGTLYEEPCVVYIKVSIDSLLGIQDPSYQFKPKSPNEPSGGRRGVKSQLIKRFKKMKPAASLPNVSSESSASKGNILRVNPLTSPHVLGHSSLSVLPRGRAVVNAAGRKLGFKFQEVISEEGDAGAGAGASSDTDMDDAVESEAGLFNFSHGSKKGENLLTTIMNSTSRMVDTAVDQLNSQTSLMISSMVVGAPVMIQVKPAWVYLKLEYAHQMYTSRLVRLHHATGEAHVRQDFVFATVRPIDSRPLEISVWITHDKTRRGRLSGRLTEDIIHLLTQSQAAEANRQAVGNVYLEGAKEIVKPTVAPKFFLPLTTMELDQPFLGVMRMHIGAADADLRAAIYGIPKLVLAGHTSNISVLRSVHSEDLSLSSAPSSVPQEEVEEEGDDGDSLGLFKKHKPDSLAPPGPPLSGEAKVPPNTKSRLARTSVASESLLIQQVSGEAESSSGEVAPSFATHEPSNVTSSTGGTASSTQVESMHGSHPLNRSARLDVECSSVGSPQDVIEAHSPPRPPSAASRLGRSGHLGRSPDLHPFLKPKRPLHQRVLSFLTELLTKMLSVMIAWAQGLIGKKVVAPPHWGVHVPFMARKSSAGSAVGLNRISSDLSNPLLSSGLAAANSPAASAAFHSATNSDTKSAKGLAPIGFHSATNSDTKSAKGLAPIGFIRLSINSIHMTYPGEWFFVVFKIGPHWVRTNAKRSGVVHADLNWQFVLPLFDPSTLITVFTFYHKVEHPKPSDILVFCRKSFNVTLFPPNLEINQNIQNKMIPSEGEEETRETRWDKRGQNNKSQQDTSCSLNYKALGIDSVWKQKDPHVCYINTTFYKEFNSLGSGVSAYTQPARPPEWYIYGLDDAPQEQLEEQYNAIVLRWLEKSHPPLPQTVSRPMLDNHRLAFSVSQMKLNMKRVKTAISLLSYLGHGFVAIKSWDNPWNNLLVYFFIMMYSFYPSKAFAICLMWLCVSVVKRHFIFLRSRAQQEDEFSPPVVPPSTESAAVGLGTSGGKEREGGGAAVKLHDDDESEESDVDAPDESLGPLAGLKKQYEA
ncbi:hypothetical protein CEUSTIGMA_g12356.t1, partial [Chlamydomonas eustigma]